MNLKEIFQPEVVQALKDLLVIAVGVGTFGGFLLLLISVGDEARNHSKPL